MPTFNAEIWKAQVVSAFESEQENAFTIFSDIVNNTEQLLKLLDKSPTIVLYCNDYIVLKWTGEQTNFRVECYGTNELYTINGDWCDSIEHCAAKVNQLLKEMA